VTEPGVSFVVPVRDGERWLDDAIGSILAQQDGRPFEVIAVDDGSVDRSPEILARHAAANRIRVVKNAARGAAAAMNQGIREARHPVVCLVDQDVVLHQGWLRELTAVLKEPRVAAAQGRFVVDPGAPAVARVAAMDLEDRYAALEGGRTTHVCTGNSAYRAAALREVGLFDESFGYGYDNDMSYRLAEAGYELRFCPQATSVHKWRETLGGYLRQQYGQGYGRLDLVAKHPRRAAGDTVSPAPMMLHAPAMLAAITAGAISAAAAATGLPWRSWLLASGLAVCALAAERLVAGVRAARRHRDRAGLLFVPIHLLRDAAWSLAIIVWVVRRALGRGRQPWHSMGSPR